MKNGFHLSGIIPVSGNKEGDLKFPWHDSLMPLGNDYLAVERSVVECAYAGCETIWIVCNDDIQPLIRYRLGDYVKDPVWFNRSKYGKYPKNETRETTRSMIAPILSIDIPKSKLKLPVDNHLKLLLIIKSSG